MKKLLPLSCALISLAGGSAAQAADYGMAPATYDWSGGYVGMNVGGALNTSTFKTDYSYAGQSDIDQGTRDLINQLDNSDTPGGGAFSAGILAGYNIQMSNFVLGVEGDFNYVGFNGTSKNNVSDIMSQVLAAENTEASDNISYDANWFGTFRGRLGYAMDNVLIYGTGGLAYGQLRVNQKLSAASGDEYATWRDDREAWNLGWTLGGGIEYGVDRWTLGLEYLYVDLGEYDFHSDGDVKLDSAELNSDWSEVKQSGKADYNFSLARATLKYRF